jgi:hypothetical protein
MLGQLTTAIEGGLLAPVQLQRVQTLVTNTQALTKVCESFCEGVYE